MGNRDPRRALGAARAHLAVGRLLRLGAIPPWVVHVVGVPADSCCEAARHLHHHAVGIPGRFHLSAHVLRWGGAGVEGGSRLQNRAAFEEL